MVGLVVIVAFGIYTVFAVFVAKRVGRLAKSRVGRNALIAAVLAVLYLAPAADGIYGYFVLQHLCATEAKTEVLKPIKIPAEYFNPDGSPKFVSGEFNRVDWKYLSSVFETKRHETNDYEFRSLRRVVRTLTDAESGEPLVRTTDLYFRGGWLQYNGEGIGNDACFSAPSFSDVLLRSIGRL